MSHPGAQSRVRAAVMALLSHSCFALAVGSMVLALATGMQLGFGRLPQPWAFLGNLLLVLQFPLLHSFLLHVRGRGLLVRLSPVGHGNVLAPTTYAWVASLQLLLTFWLWTPSGTVWRELHGVWAYVAWLPFGAAFAFLHKALVDADLNVQTGAIGWRALWRGQPPVYSPMPTRGLFAFCRQPIYLGFAMVLWTAPVWSPDWLLLSLGWSLYCVVGPLLKEARWLRRYGSVFTAYQQAVPYILPRLPR